VALSAAPQWARVRAGHDLRPIRERARRGLCCFSPVGRATRGGGPALTAFSQVIWPQLVRHGMLAPAGWLFSGVGLPGFRKSVGLGCRFRDVGVKVTRRRWLRPRPGSGNTAPHSLKGKVRGDGDGGFLFRFGDDLKRSSASAGGRFLRSPSSSKPGAGPVVRSGRRRGIVVSRFGGFRRVR